MNDQDNSINFEGPNKGIVEGANRKKYDYDDATIDEMLADAKDEIRNETEKKIDQLNNLVEESRKDYLIILGIFVSLITFISAEIQILKVAPNATLLIGLSSLMIGGLLMFVMTLTNFVKENNDWSKIGTPLFLLPVLFFLVGLLLFYFNA